MPSPNSQSKRSSSILPIASHSTSMQAMYEWLQYTVENVEYGKVGIEFTLHQSMVTRVQKTVVISELPKGG